MKNNWWLATANCRSIYQRSSPIEPQFLPVGAAHTRIKRVEGTASERASERGRKSRMCDVEPVRHTTKPSEVPQSPVPGLYRSLSSSLKQCGPCKNKEINTERQRPAVWIRNLSLWLFVLRFYRTVACLPHRAVPVPPARLSDTPQHIHLSFNGHPGNFSSSANFTMPQPFRFSCLYWQIQDWSYN